MAGNHTLRFGFDYRRLMPTYAPTTFAYGTLVSSVDEITSGIPLLQGISARQGAEVRFNNYSFFGQDDWKVNKRLTLNFGLRYEINPAPYDANGIQPITLTGINGTDVRNATLAPAGTPFFKTFKTAFAPRLGAAYQLGDKPGGETVVRGGFGVYYVGNSQSLNGFNTFPFSANRNEILQLFPLPPSQFFPPTFSTVTLPLTSTVFTSDPDLKLPYTLQYNVGVERSLGENQAISVSYVGSKARRLLTVLALNSRVGGVAPNRNFGTISYTTNRPTSDYDSMQAQFTRRFTRGFQALANYTWSHAIDTASDEFSGDFARGSAGFDVRHNFSAALTYEIPTFTENRFARAVFGGFALDSTIYLQSGQPIDIFAGQVSVIQVITNQLRVVAVPRFHFAGAEQSRSPYSARPECKNRETSERFDLLHSQE